MQSNKNRTSVVAAPFRVSLFVKVISEAAFRSSSLNIKLLQTQTNSHATDSSMYANLGHTRVSNAALSYVELEYNLLSFVQV